MNRVVAMRVQIAKELGFVMPGVQFKDNKNVEPNTYFIQVRGKVGMIKLATKEASST